MEENENTSLAILPEECRLAFGKPQTILETNGEVQWMYSSSFYLFFKDGRVLTIIK